MAKKTVKKTRAKRKTKAKRTTRTRKTTVKRASRAKVKPVAFYRQPIVVLSNGVDRVFSFFK